MAAAVDELVVLVHAVRAPSIFDPRTARSWVEAFSCAIGGRAFRVAVPTYRVVVAASCSPPIRSRSPASSARSTHGVKAMYAHGDLLEFAVFDLEELALARVNRYRVLLDRADVTARIEAVRVATRAATSTPPDQRAPDLLGVVVDVQRGHRSRLFPVLLRDLMPTPADRLDHWLGGCP